jgi:hypothetical protein
MRTKNLKHAALPGVVGLMAILAAITLACEGQKRFVAIQKEFNTTPPGAPESPIGSPVYPNAHVWLMDHEAVRYGQTPEQVKENLQQMEPMCGIRFSLAPTAWPWVRPLPYPFHGKTTFEGKYREVLELWPTQTLVAGAVVFNLDDKAAFLYDEGAFNTPYWACLPGDDETINAARAIQPPLKLTALDHWLSVEAKLFELMHHAKTKDDVKHACDVALEDARPECWKLEELKVDDFKQGLERIGDCIEDDNLICLRRNLSATSVQVLYVDDGITDGSYSPLFNRENGQPYLSHSVFHVYLAGNRVTGVAMERRAFPVLNWPLPKIPGYFDGMYLLPLGHLSFWRQNETSEPAA